jgi:hypothetical protein
MAEDLVVDAGRFRGRTNSLSFMSALNVMNQGVLNVFGQCLRFSLPNQFGKMSLMHIAELPPCDLPSDRQEH